MDYGKERKRESNTSRREGEEREGREEEEERVIVE